MVTSAVVRSAVAAARAAHDISERRACAILGADRRSVRYISRCEDDAPVRAQGNRIWNLLDKLML